MPKSTDPFITVTKKSRGTGEKPWDRGAATVIRKGTEAGREYEKSRGETLNQVRKDTDPWMEKNVPDVPMSTRNKSVRDIAGQGAADELTRRIRKSESGLGVFGSKTVKEGGPYAK